MIHSNTRKLVAAVSMVTLVTGLGVSQLSAAAKPNTQVDSAPVKADRAATRLGGETPADLADLKLDTPLQMQSSLDAIIGADPRNATGRQTVIVRLQGKSVAKHPDKSPSGRISHKEKLKSDQAAFVNRASKVSKGSKQVASTQVVLNAVFMQIDGADIAELAKDPDVYSINRVRNYEMDLAETVPYIGGTAAHRLGYDGEGVRVAVLDSGVDYYHAALGGSGVQADFDADDPTIIEPGSFPTAKVVGGYDFVGGNWPFTFEEPDEDPLDAGPANGHGTHVADIIGGALGVAPAADIYAVKVCSSMTSSCSGIALIQGMDFAADPDRDGDPSDAVDIVNMSLGSSYGQAFDDDLAAAVDNASALGVLTVASAGNSGDKPYANGTPAGALTALSVAQTQVPSARLPFIAVDGTDYASVFQPWSVEPIGVVSGNLQYADGIGGNLNGCAPFAPVSLTGLVVLVDRGVCNFTLKIQNIGDAGGIVGIIGLVAPGDPFGGGDGGDPVTIPGYMVSQSDSSAMKLAAGSLAEIDPAKGIALVGHMVGSSARGPQHDAPTLIKPEIGAPGASVSAIAGKGTDTGPFGGTSGAAPMVSGSAALLLQSEPDLTPAEAKARLMNTGDTDISTDPLSGLAPITRIGGGEVRVDKAIMAPTAAWDRSNGQGALSFGFIDVDKEVVNLQKQVEIKNFSGETVQYRVSASFRYEDDEASGAVSISVPSGKVRIKAGGTAIVPVKLTIDGTMLSGNAMNSGSQGANPDALTASEYDGYITFDDGDKPIHMAWHVLPRKAANVNGRSVLNFDGGIDVVDLNNKGVGEAQNDAYSVIAVSPNQPEGGLGEQSPTPDIRAVGVNTFPVPAGFCSAEDSFVWVFAVNTWERQQHLLPVTHQVLLDIDQDEIYDYAVINRDLSGLSSISDGRQLTWAYNIATGGATAFFFAEHATNTANTVMLICGEQIGLTGTDILATNVDVTVVAQDFYYGGPGDEVGGITITPLGEQYYGLPEDISGKSEGTMSVIDFGPFPGNTPELGVMLFTNGDRGAGNRGGATPGTEALIFSVK